MSVSFFQRKRDNLEIAVGRARARPVDFNLGHDLEGDPMLTYKGLDFFRAPRFLNNSLMGENLHS